MCLGRREDDCPPDGSVLARIVKDGEIKLEPPGIAIAVAELFG
jgi:hypothetical protein